QDGGNDYYRGITQYVKKLDASDCKVSDQEELYLEFKGVAMSASVYVNQKLVAEHKGGYSTFCANITDAVVDGENILAVLVNNEENTTVYPQRADFTFYGGIYRDVNLCVVDKAHFEMDYFGGNGIKITPEVKDHSAEITCEAWVSGGDNVTFSISSSESEAVVAKANVTEGYAKTVISMENVHLWNGTKDPFLYDVKAELENNGATSDAVDTRIGLRSFYNDPEKGFILNGESYPLRGVSRHQDRWEVGNAITLDMHKEDLSIIMDMGANTIRLAHYQHAQEFYDLCDEKGIVLWAEIPYITNHMDDGYDNTISQMSELITQCYHHPSIVCWGLSNEITVGGEITDFLVKNHKDLNDLCHKMDTTRFTTMAHAFMLDIDEPFVRLADVCSYNLYFGWYLGELSENEAFFDEYHKKYPNAIVGFSEYGADANPQYHSSTPDKGDYTEEYQCVYHEHILNCIKERPYLWATHVWNMFDFAADGRDEGGKNGQNQKGLVTFDRKEKKDAFYLYKATWNKTDKFVHLCGHRYVDRAEEKTPIKVYSNMPSVTLYVDGKEFETKTGEVVFNFEVPISGTHTIEAKAESFSDSITVKRVDAFNEDYRLAGAAPVVNWFDKDEIDPNFYSIKDTMGDIKKNPQAGGILAKMMEKMVASRGDVAESASGNKALQKMLDKMTLESLIKQAGDAVPVEMIKQLNAAFQQIPKE
nr:glycoside hydrolase family 2 protein [Lachnospiraceae bacterium]